MQIFLTSPHSCDYILLFLHSFLQFIPQRLSDGREKFSALSKHETPKGGGRRAWVGELLLGAIYSREFETDFELESH
jgi:hypothetical protein